MIHFIVVCTVIALFALSYAGEDTCNDCPHTERKRPTQKTGTGNKKRETATSTYQSGYKIRQPNEKPQIKREKPAPAIILDNGKLEELRQQTQIAQKLLSDIFTEEEEVHIPDNNTSNAVIEALQKLLEKDTWQREEVQELLGANVMIGNMLEQINDYAYSKMDDIVVEEDGDTIHVTTEYKEQLI